MTNHRMGDWQAVPSKYLRCRDKEEVPGNKGHEEVRDILEGNKYGKYRDQ